MIFLLENLIFKLLIMIFIHFLETLNFYENFKFSLFHHISNE